MSKAQAAKDILGTKTLTDTVDAALTEVVKLGQRKALVELIFTPEALALDDPDVIAGAWPRAQSTAAWIVPRRSVS